jgi:hypothetical protein
MELRDNSQADYDLEKLFELMDEALTSKDERVQSALRGLLTIIELTRVQDDGKHAIETSHGPLRQMQEDLNNINRRLWAMQDEIRKLQQSPPYVPPNPYNPPAVGSPFGPYTNPGGLGPIWTTSQSSSSYTLTDEEKDRIISKLS